MSMQFKILLSRFLTRFGDQAWDFAVPLVLIQIFPGKIQIIALVYLLSKLAQILIGPAIARKIDNTKRISIYKMGIGSQTIAMIFMWVSIIFLYLEKSNGANLNLNHYFFILTLLALFSAVSSLGSSLMDISVGFDLAVDVLPENELTTFNSRLKRLDLLTEVTAPIFTGLVFSLFTNKSEFWGFSIVALLNLMTFIPEFYLLKSAQSSDNYKEKLIVPSSPDNFLKVFFESIKKLKNKSYALVIFSYALLWLSALSPHGVLLTSYLKDGAKTSELTIGFFRGFGALFGLIPTFLFLYLKEKHGLIQTSKLFIIFQFACVTLSAIGFYYITNIYFFLIFILFSRIGLYGFSIGETELRQLLIPKEKRGEVNGIANSTTSMATLILFLAAALIGDTANFGIMVLFSVLAVFISLILFIRFSKQNILSQN
jgi:iron-regulated transporter 1